MLFRDGKNHKRGSHSMSLEPGNKKPQSKTSGQIMATSKLITVTIHSPKFLTSTSDLLTIDTRSDADSSAGPPEPPKKVHIPPIILQVGSWKSLSLKLKHLQITANFSNDQIRLQASNIDTFRTIQNLLSEIKVPFHTFSFPSEKKLKILLRGIPTFYSKEELINIGYAISHVRQFLKGGRKFPMYMITLPSNKSGKFIFVLTLIYYISIKVETYTMFGPSQCFAFQGFGHSSAHCRNAARCVKFGNDHPTKVCTKTAKQPPRCCNCGYKHTVNYRKSPTYVTQTIL